MFSDNYSGTRVLLTGDTGFKGTWLALWLRKLGAEVYGLSLPPENDSTLFVRTGLDDLVKHSNGDIRDLRNIEEVFRVSRPNIVFHLAAQALVRESFRDPVGTMLTNVVGTAHVCDVLRRYEAPCALVVITSDKCYENHEWVFGYRENDPMGGADPYSASKGAAELLTSSWRRSFLPLEKISQHQKPVATARAGNAIGPGDWARDRIVPDAVRALLAKEPIIVRHPNSIRPWQHVLEPLSGYLCLGAKLLSSNPADFADCWNFGPLPGSVRCVKDLVDQFIIAWGDGTWVRASEIESPSEAQTLRLIIDKAVAQLNWFPVWGFDETIRRTAEGYRRINDCWDHPNAVRGVIEDEIALYTKAANSINVAWARRS
jgi:CDP-glucose 4,6-dehydratase